MDAWCTKCGAAFGSDDMFCAKCGNARGVLVSTVASPKSEPIAASGPGVGALIALVAAFTIVPIALVFGGGSCSGEATGQVVVEGPGPSFTFVPRACASMFPYGRFGGNLHGARPNDGGVYVTTDPTKGALVEIEVPGSCKGADGTDCTVFAVPREACSTYEVHVERNGVIYNEVPLVDGRAKLGCTLVDGTIVTGILTFTGC